MEFLVKKCCLRGKNKRGVHDQAGRYQFEGGDFERIGDTPDHRRHRNYIF